MSEILYLARRYPLGVAGAIIMTVFVFAAVFAGTVAPPMVWAPATVR